jgi:hypothetical protein
MDTIQDAFVIAIRLQSEPSKRPAELFPEMAVKSSNSVVQ